MSLSLSANRRRIVLILSVMVLAFSAGHIMQNVLARDMNIAVRNMAPDAEPTLRRSTQAPGLPVPPAATLTPFEAPDPVPSDRITDDPPLPELPLEDASVLPLDVPCRVAVDAVAGDAGVIWLEVSAPCSAGEIITVAQEGMAVEWALDGAGRLSADLPAMTVAPVIEVKFPGGLSEAVRVILPDVEDLVRVALVWEGHKVLGLHALESGASYGESGHIHAASPGRIETGGSTGFLVQLGDGSGRMAEVYTRPTGQGSVRFLAEAGVSSESCERIVTATALQTDQFAGVMSRELQLTMPSCDNLGDIVSLTTLFRNLRIAAR
ncbi:MAG: hypothetical protein KJO30_11710 [Boseongicola sp.]|nr:hypothetical protein [Boseongicola sp.]NNJ67090.1 hypothetical protein [Boseongicola sp.]